MTEIDAKTCNLTDKRFEKNLQRNAREMIVLVQQATLLKLLLVLGD